jgi:hypothetical protein
MIVKIGDFDYSQPLLVVFDGLIKFRGHHYDFIRNIENQVCLKIWDKEVQEIGIISLINGETLFRKYRSINGWPND